MTTNEFLGAGESLRGRRMADNSQRTGVICKKCNTPIAVRTPEKVAEEFSVACPKCGHRGFYRVKDIKMLNGR